MPLRLLGKACKKPLNQCSLGTHVCWWSNTTMKTQLSAKCLLWKEFCLLYRSSNFFHHLFLASFGVWAPKFASFSSFQKHCHPHSISCFHPPCSPSWLLESVSFSHIRRAWNCFPQAVFIWHHSSTLTLPSWCVLYCHTAGKGPVPIL